jgi:hypothetical protein
MLLMIGDEIDDVMLLMIGDDEIDDVMLLMIGDEVEAVRGAGASQFDRTQRTN